MSEYTEKDKNLKLISNLKSFYGGDNEDVPIHQESLSHMETIVNLCDKHDLPQPEIFPWAGGDGIQAEWDYKDDWYIELDSNNKGISLLLCENHLYSEAIEITSMADIENAFRLIKVFITKVVKSKFESI